MTDIRFRYADRGDAPALVDLIERAYRGSENAGAWTSEADLLTGPRTSIEEISALIARTDSRFLIAELGGALAGCCLLQGLSPEPVPGSDPAYQTSFAVPGYRAEKPAPRAINAAYFGMFAISPSAHGAGLGKLVIAEAERRVQQLWRCNQMVMTVINLRTTLIEWYQRRGYRLTGARMPFPFTETSGETHRNFDLVEMRKDLA